MKFKYLFKNIDVMKKQSNGKQMLFEMMEKINPDFKSSLNEGEKWIGKFGPRDLQNITTQATEIINMGGQGVSFNLAGVDFTLQKNTRRGSGFLLTSGVGLGSKPIDLHYEAMDIGSAVQAAYDHSMKQPQAQQQVQ
jgi:hypothetical protein